MSDTVTIVTHDQVLLSDPEKDQNFRRIVGADEEVEVTPDEAAFLIEKGAASEKESKRSPS